MARLSDRRDRPEQWRDVPGFGGRYQASTTGHVRKVLGDGRTRLLKEFYHDRWRHTLFVQMIAPDGAKKIKPVLQVIAKTWKPPPDGYIVMHRSRSFLDNSVDNIAFGTNGDLARFMYTTTRKAVVEIDENGEAVNVYASLHDAAQNSRLTAEAIRHHCKGRIINRRYVYDDDYDWG